MQEDKPQPVDVYKAIIDELVEMTPSMTGGWILEGKPPVDPEFAELVASLSPRQRSIVARLCNDEREGAIHDVLAHLTWWITCRDVGLSLNGEPMPTELSGMGLHGDYIGRRQNWDWPEDQ